MNKSQIAHIVEQVVSQLQVESPHRGAPALHLSSFGRGSEIGGRGVHSTVDQAIKAAQKAFLDLHECSLEDRSRFIKALRDVTRGELETIAQLAVQETGLGRVHDKIEKMKTSKDL